MAIDKSSKPRPVYVKRLPPCNNTCPAGHNIQQWLSYAKQSKFRESWDVMMQNHPLPATLGRVCYHPCEDGCNRRSFDAAVNINAVERFVGDMGLSETWTVKCDVEPSGNKVLVVGAGPAGLAAAYHLKLLGHEVVIRDQRSVAGGMMHYGIPSYRLPRHVLDAEIKRIENMGIKIELNHEVSDLAKEREDGRFAAVFVALGAPVGRVVNIPHEGNGCQVLDAVQFLDDIEHGKASQLDGLKVAVYGGGNTAIDAARCALRLNAKKVEIVYRRNREKMPAYDFEIAEAAAEGVTLRLLRTIKEIDNNKLTLDIMELNAEGWPEPIDKTETIEADVVIMALGLNVATDFLRQIEGIEFKKDGCILTDDNLMTGAKNIFAGGDVIPYDRSVATALGHGKKAASNIDAHLRDATVGATFKVAQKEKHQLADMHKIVPEFYPKEDRKNRSKISLAHSKESFDEVVRGLTEDEIIHESSRCFSCGNCFECDTCMNVCPVKAIHKIAPGKGYHIDYDACIRCGLCVKKCPCGAMEMV